MLEISAAQEFSLAFMVTSTIELRRKPQDLCLARVVMFSGPKKARIRIEKECGWRKMTHKTHKTHPPRGIGRVSSAAQADPSPPAELCEFHELFRPKPRQP
jgi:hypothetical protein